jgi:hypothetical protein
MRRNETMTEFPTKEEVAREIRALAKRLAADGIQSRGEGLIDLRLQVYPDGHWALRWGPPDYDPDHRGWWGASFLPPPSAPMLDFRATAAELLEQAMEQAAMSDDDDDEF